MGGDGTCSVCWVIPPRGGTAGLPEMGALTFFLLLFCVLVPVFLFAENAILSSSDLYTAKFCGLLEAQLYAPLWQEVLLGAPSQSFLLFP